MTELTPAQSLFFGSIITLAGTFGIGLVVYGLWPKRPKIDPPSEPEYTTCEVCSHTYLTRGPHSCRIETGLISNSAVFGSKIDIAGRHEPDQESFCRSLVEEKHFFAESSGGSYCERCDHMFLRGEVHSCTVNIPKRERDPKTGRFIKTPASGTLDHLLSPDTRAAYEPETR